jgi:uncharacterized membrane protein YbhN (UPF0104 family)
MKVWLTRTSWLVSIAGIIFLLRTFLSHLSEVPEIDWTVGKALIVGFGVLVFCVTTFLQSLTWRVLLRGGGVPIGVVESYVLLGRSQMAKYFPGNVFHFVSRIAAGVQRGISSEALILSTGLEALITTATASGVVMLGILGGLFPIPHLLEVILTERLSIAWWLLLLAVAVFCALIGFSSKLKIWVKARLAFVRSRSILLAVCFVLVMLSINGMLIAFLYASVWQATSVLMWYQFGIGFALAWVLGFIVPGAPGGVGVREAVFVSIFSPFLGAGIASALAIGLRLVTTLSDVATFGLASAIPLAARRPDASR